MFSSSFTGTANYMLPFGELVQDSGAVKNFRQTLTLWDFHSAPTRRLIQ